MIPQIIYIVLTILGIGFVIQRDGKAPEGNNNMVSDIMTLGIIFSLYWSGGFFDGMFPLGLHALPQVMILLFMGIDIVRGIYKHGTPNNPSRLWVSLVTTGIVIGTLIWGGFFDCFFR